MEFKRIEDYWEAVSIFTRGAMTDDENAKNYTAQQFERAWPKYTVGFFVFFDGNEPAAFCGVRDYGDKYARIFDRYFIEPDYRKPSLSHRHLLRNPRARGEGIFSPLMLPTLTQAVIEADRIPFFSTQWTSKRRAFTTIVDSFNKELTDMKYHVLDGEYETAHESYQLIAMLDPHRLEDPSSLFAPSSHSTSGLSALS